MNILSSVTMWNDALGKRISITYSEVDETGKVISDNNRVDRVVTDAQAKQHADAIAEYAQSFIDGE